MHFPGIKKLVGPNSAQQSERFQVAVSDGRHWMRLMFATQLNDHSKSGALTFDDQCASIIRLEEHLTNAINNRV